MASLSFTSFALNVLGLRMTHGQFVYARVAFDGADPVDLTGREREIALELFGGVERFTPESRRQMVLRFGRTSGKSLLCAAYGVYRMFTADLSSCGPGDRPAVLVVSCRKEEAGIILGVARELVLRSKKLRKSIVRTREDRFVVRRWDKRKVIFKTAPKSAGGGSVRGLSIILAIIDESEFVGTNKPGAVFTDKNIIDAAHPRIIGGGALILASTPWPAISETSKIFDSNFGNPATAICAFAPTLSLRGDNPEVVARIAFERARDPKNALREYDCLISDADGLFYEQSSIEQAISKTLPQPTKLRGTAGIDLAFKGDSSGLCIVERQGDKVVVIALDLISPQAGVPLVPSEVMGKFSVTAKAFGTREFAADGHYIETAREVAHLHGLQVSSGPRGPQVNKAHLYLRDLLRERKLVLPNDPRLLGQLKSVTSQPQPGGGLTITLSRAQGTGHCDLVSALLAAIWHDRRHGHIATASVSDPIKGPPLRGSAIVGPLPFGSVGLQRWS